MLTQEFPEIPFGHESSTPWVKIMIESNPRKSRIVVRRLAVRIESLLSKEGIGFVAIRSSSVKVGTDSINIEFNYSAFSYRDSFKTINSGKFVWYRPNPFWTRTPCTFSCVLLFVRPPFCNVGRQLDLTCKVTWLPYGFYHKLNNLHFRYLQTISNCCVLEACSHLFSSSELLRCRLLNWLLDHPMNHIVDTARSPG